MNNLQIRALAELELRKRNKTKQSNLVFDNWEEWLNTIFPDFFDHSFSEYHKEFWDYIWNIDENRPSPFVAIWPRGSGKCEVGTTNVTLIDGNQKMLRDVVVGDKVLSYNEHTGKFEKDEVLTKWNSGKKEVLDIKTRTGKTISCTPEHKILTFDGWKQAKDITLNDRLAAPRYIPNYKKDYSHSDEAVRFLGYMIAEGSTVDSITFTNFDHEIIDDFIYCATSLGMEVKQIREGQYRVNKCRQWARDNQLFGCKAINKRMPAWVFSLPDYQKWILLSTLIDTDGYITCGKNIGITLANEYLIRDIERLFLQVGVLTSFYYKKNNHAGAWTLIIDQDCIDACCKNMTLLLKQDKLFDLSSTLRYSLIDTYPSKIFKSLRKGLSRELRNNNIIRIDYQYDATRNKVRTLLDYEMVDSIYFLETAHVFWDKVISIANGGIEETFDLEIKNNHNFLSNHLVTHNSTSAELSAIMLGALNKRNYIWYVSSTSEQANRHVQSIASILESESFAQHYPAMSRRKLSKYSTSRGWRNDLLRTESGLTIQALGLDQPSRGARSDTERVNVIIADDLDNVHDSQLTTKKKIETLTKSILPSGSTNCVIILIQNLISNTGIFSKLASDKADFLLDKKLSGPHPAIKALEYQVTNKGIKNIRGKPTWDGLSIDTCKAFINAYGISAFLSEMQHEIKYTEGMFSNVSFQHIDDAPKLKRIVCCCDPAVTNKDTSDHNAVCVAGVDYSKNIYVLESWQKRAGPEETINKAINLALKYDLSKFYIEGNQGHDTWKVLSKRILEDRNIPFHKLSMGLVVAPSNKSKEERISQMLLSYETGKMFHVVGTHVLLEQTLLNFGISKPYDLCDALWHCWNKLINENAFLLD